MPMKRKTVIKIIIGIVAFILIKNLLYYTEVEYSYPIWSKDGKRIYYIKTVDYYRFAQGGFSLNIGFTRINPMSCLCDPMVQIKK